MLIKIPKNILNYKSKVLGSFTVRQGVFGILGAIVICAFGFGFFFPDMPTDLRQVIATFIGLPLLAFGFVEPYGMPLEKIIPIFVMDNFVYPTVRYYKTEYKIEDFSEPKLDKNGKPVKIKPEAKKKLKAKDIKPSKDPEYQPLY